MAAGSLSIERVAGEFGVCRLDPGAEPPAPSGPIHSVTRVGDELSVVCSAADVPGDAIASEGPFAALKIAGPLDFSLTGILYSMLAPLAEDEISIFAISTHETDYVLVRSHEVEAAAESLREEGHDVAI